MKPTPNTEHESLARRLIKRPLNILHTASNTVHMTSLISLYAGNALLGKLFISDPDKRLTFFTENVRQWTARALRAMNIELELVGYEKDKFATKNFLFVSNHMSYADVLIMASLMPCVFVTSVDMKETPVLGDLAEMGGSIFVERRHRGQIGQDISTMSNALRSGYNVMIYPEGTSTDGQTVLPFKKSLLMAAVEADRDIIPVCIKYLEIDGEPFSRKNAHKVCWYGDMKFAPHFLGMMTLKSVKAQLEFLPPVKVKPDSTRQELASATYQAIFKAYTGQEPKPEAAPRSRSKSKTH